MKYMEPTGVMRYKAVRGAFWVFALGTGAFTWAMVVAGVVGALALAASVAYILAVTIF